MKTLHIHLPDELYAELETVAGRTAGSGADAISPRTWCEDAVASALASRRLQRTFPGGAVPERYVRSYVGCSAGQAARLGAVEAPTAARPEQPSGPVGEKR